MNTTALNSPVVLIKPSKALIEYAKNLEVSDDIPENIKNIRLNKTNTSQDYKLKDRELLINSDDIMFINNLNLDDSSKVTEKKTNDECEDLGEFVLNLDDCKWLHDIIHLNNKSTKEKKYFHVLFEGSNVVLPKNVEVPRSPELEKRCQKLKAQQENNVYKRMTKNVDNVRFHHPEDTIAYQMKQINSHLIAVAQFIVSVLAGFAFGFLGVELMIGRLDFGFRLLLGIICSLIIALAELYFLAKKLNEDLEFTQGTTKEAPNSKIKTE